VAGEMTIE